MQEAEVVERSQRGVRARAWPRAAIARRRGSGRRAHCMAGAAHAQEGVIETLPRDLSPWGMYLNADPVVKARADRACVRLGRHLDGVARQDHRAHRRQAARARGARRTLPRARSSEEGADALASGRNEVRRLPRRGGRRAEALRRRGRNRRHQGARRLAARAHRGGLRRGASRAAPACSPPSARPRRSSACSARSGAS